MAPVCSQAFLAAHPVGRAEDLLALPLLHMASRPGGWKHWFDSLRIAGAPGAILSAGPKKTVDLAKLKKDLAKAVEEENYEKAAKLRDQIRQAEA